MVVNPKNIRNKKKCSKIKFIIHYIILCYYIILFLLNTSWIIEIYIKDSYVITFYSYKTMFNKINKIIQISLNSLYISEQNNLITLFRIPGLF